MSSRRMSPTRWRTRRQECRWSPAVTQSPEPRRGSTTAASSTTPAVSGFVADLTGRRGHDIVAQALTVLRNLEHRGAKGSDPDTGDGAGHPDPDPGRVLPRGLRVRAARAGRLRGRAGLPARRRRPTRAAAMATIERIAAEEGLAVLGWREVPHDPDLRRGTRGRCCRACAQLFVAGARRRAGIGAGPARVLPAQARRARDRRLLRQPVVGDDRLQGHAHRAAARAVLPGPVRPAVRARRWPWCTPGSPPTPSRPGRWPTRTGSSRTTARSTRSAATGTGCGPARRCWPPT